MKLDDPQHYYAERDVTHTAQGDIHAGVPFVHATMFSPEFEAVGARKRPDGADSDQAVVTSHHGLGVVLHYTCGITAQPPGTRGYSHEFRLLAQPANLLIDTTGGPKILVTEDRLLLVLGKQGF